MNEVRHRSRKAKAAGAREVQGVFAITGQESETEHETTDRTFETMRAEPPTPKPTPTRTPRSTTKTTDLRPLPFRTVVAVWPDEWRERWGCRANELQDNGLSWCDAESRAFREVLSAWRGTADVVRRN